MLYIDSGQKIKIIHKFFFAITNKNNKKNVKFIISIFELTWLIKNTEDIYTHRCYSTLGACQCVYAWCGRLKAMGWNKS